MCASAIVVRAERHLQQNEQHEQRDAQHDLRDDERQEDGGLGLAAPAETGSLAQARARPLVAKTPWRPRSRWRRP